MEQYLHDMINDHKPNNKYRMENSNIYVYKFYFF